MTRIASRKTVMRGETNATVRGLPLVVTLEAHEILIRQKGRRFAYAVPYLGVYELGAKLHAMEERAKKGKR